MHYVPNILHLSTKMTRVMPPPLPETEGKSLKPHIMVFPYPAQGHLLPLLDLTHQLCLHGDIAVSIIVKPKNLPYLSPLLTAHPSAVSAVTFPSLRVLHSLLALKTSKTSVLWETL